MNTASGQDTVAAPRAEPAWYRVVVAIGLGVLVALVFHGVFGFEFINFDDPEYVTLNPYVNAGLTADGFRWAWRTTYGAMWCPPTWLSHQLDVSLYGLNPAGHHATNFGLHILNVLLLFVALRAMTRNTWASAVVAALFAVHPLRVESVAWIAERKGLLSVAFALGALLAYIRYVRRPHWMAMAGCTLLLAVSLMAKPVLVAFPLLLLVLDAWPLRRYEGKHGDALWRTVRRCVIEKVPLFVMVALGAMVTFLVHRAAGDVRAETPLSLRAANTVLSYAWYVGKLIWPSRLAVFYPYPAGIPPLQVIGALGLLVGISVVVTVRARRQPYLLVGWLWYIVALLPTSGLVRFGDHARADRFSYVPSMGLLIMLVWGMQTLVRKLRPMAQRRLGAGLAMVAVMVYGGLGTLQARHWRTAEALWAHTAKVTPPDYTAPLNLGTILMEKGRIADALPHLREAQRLQPHDGRVNFNLGFALMQQGQHEAADPYFVRSADFEPLRAGTHLLIGRALARAERYAEAEARFRAALEMAPRMVEAHVDLAGLLLVTGRNATALRQVEHALQIAPDFTPALKLRAYLVDNGSG